MESYELRVDPTPRTTHSMAFPLVLIISRMPPGRSCIPVVMAGVDFIGCEYTRKSESLTIN